MRRGVWSAPWSRPLILVFRCSGSCGQVSPKLYGARVDLRDEQVMLTYYVAPELTDDEHDAVGAMVAADGPDEYCIEGASLMSTTSART